ncbi:MAG: M20 family metallo-hydrolase [Bacteroidota bacterium]
MVNQNKQLTNAIDLLKKLIATPSISKEEDVTASIIADYLVNNGISVQRHLNNIWCVNHEYDAEKPTILLNSHHDTVKPNRSYTRDPHEPSIEDGKMFGLGSNDAGGPLVSLIETFMHFYNQKDLKYNLVLAATGDEETSGETGIVSILDKLPPLDMAIVGEPTSLDMAVAEKGLMVLDCVAHGKSGHAARDEGENAIFNAIKDIEWFNTYKYDKLSISLGPIKMTTTLIEAGTQHNVVPDHCNFVVDVRTTDVYSNEETLEIIKQNVQSDVKARTTRLNPSGVDDNHVLVQAGKSLGLKTYGSPTLSDQAHMDFPSIKLGPGDSARSHTANEYIYIEQIEKGIETYINLLTQILK